MMCKKPVSFICFVVVWLFAMGGTAFAGQIIRVDIDREGGDGTSWLKAYKNLQDALHKPPTSGDQIWVAEGTYKPDEGGGQTAGDRTATFQLISGVAIYGGFAGNETALEQRNWDAHKTILSGDIGTPGSNADNSLHVITGIGTSATTSLLDGFTVTKGNANGAVTNGRGAGMYIDSGSPTVKDCTFSGNSAAERGGGMDVKDGNPVLTNCTFSENSANGDGGGLNVLGNPTLTNCTFRDNTVSGIANLYGGGMHVHGGSGTTVLNNCSFFHNSIISPTASCFGGGLESSNGGSRLELKNCVLIGNSIDSNGVYNCYGGGICAADANVKLTNCLFSGNWVRDVPGRAWGGGLFTGDYTLLANCTFSGNEAGAGGGIFGSCGLSCANITLVNSIFWGNTAVGTIEEQQIYMNEPGCAVRYSCVQGLSTYAGNNNIGDDPQFQDADGVDNVVGTEDDNLRLNFTSPCIDAGNNGDVPGGVITDLDDKLRFFDCQFVPDSGSGTPPIVDVGAYEAHCEIVEYSDDIKWSQPPVEVNEGDINGWDEVSIFDANCWDCPTQCHGDADCDGYVGPADNNILVAAYGTSQGQPNYNPCADFDRDGNVNTTDQQILVSAWGTNPPANCPSARAIVADDWVCKDDKPIKDIHWWGSFKGWAECVPPADEPNAFHIGIWTDVPDTNSMFSHPGRLIWEKVCSCYVWSYAGNDLDPRGIDQNETCFKFDQLLSQNEWFYQDSNDGKGRIYWLSIAAIYDPCEPEPNHPWGWKTRPHFYYDDAVRITDINDGSWPPTIGAVWASGEPIEYPAGTSWDTAFVLTANRHYEPRTCGPIEGDLNGDCIVDFEDFALMAPNWLAEYLWP